MTWARLTPTLTHVVTRDPVTSGAENDAMSLSDAKQIYSPKSVSSSPYKGINC